MNHKVSKKSLKPDDLIHLYYCLEQFLSANIPMADLLKTFRFFSLSKGWDSILYHIESCLIQGYGLSYALNRYPKIFNPFVIRIIFLGERTGNLEIIFRLLREQVSKAKILQQNLHQALLYPFFILIILVGVFYLFSFHLIPQVLGLLENMGEEPPFVTRLFLKISHFLGKNGGPLVGIIVFILGSLRIGIQLKSSWRFLWDKTLYKIPFLGLLWIRKDYCLLFQLLYVMIKSQIPLQETFLFLPSLFRNSFFRQSLFRIFSLMEEGYSLAEAWEKTNLSDPLIIRLLKVGEKTGTMESSLHYLQKIYEENLNRQGAFLLTMIQPLLLTMLGALVIFVLLAVIGPLYQTVGGLAL